MSFFNDKILTIRDKINHLLLSIGTDLCRNVETAVKPDIYLDCFSPVDLTELSNLTFLSKILEQLPISCVIFYIVIV